MRLFTTTKSFITTLILVFSINASAQSVDTLALNHPEYLPSLEVGTEAPEFVACDTLGRSIALSQYRGRYVVLDFWATWCGDCRREVPMLKQLYASDDLRSICQPNDVQWISFSFDDKEENWRSFLRRENFPWPQVSNLKRTRQDPTFQAYQLHWIPAFFVIDPDGRILGKAITAQGLENVLLSLKQRKGME